MSTNIDLIDTARYYRGLPHQVEALKYLQAQISKEALEKFADIWRTPIANEYLTLNDLYTITVSATKTKLEAFIKPLNDGFQKFGVNTPLRIAHFMAQTLHESGEFQYQEEIADGSAYEGRSDLGNTSPGDGRQFKGRGLIQVTGRYNYVMLSRDIGVDYVSNPKRLAQIPDCVNSAFWYWNSRGLNAQADNDDFDGITRAINGGFNGYDDRLKYLKRAKDALGIG